MNWRGLKRGVAGVLALAVSSAALVTSFSATGLSTEQDGNARAKLQEAHEVFLDELQAFVDWCNENRMFRARARALERILILDPEHVDARRILGYEKKDEDWLPPPRPKRFVDRTEGLDDEADKRFRQALAFFVDFIVLQLDDPTLTPAGIDLLQREALRVAPDDARVHDLRGEVLLDGRWVLRESDIAQRNRAELRNLIKELVGAVPEPKAGKLSVSEQAFGLPLQVVTVPGLRVLTTGELDEAQRVVNAMGSARRLFDTVFGVEGFFPSGCRVFLLRPDEKRPFLEKHPRVNAAILERLERLEGSGIDGTADWAFWEGDEAKRLDGVVRMTLDWFFNKNLEISLATGWLHEGFGLYLTYALVGTRQTWFVNEGVNPRGAYAMRRRLLDPDTHWMEAAHEMLASEDPPDLLALLSKNSSQLSVEDLLAAYSLSAFLFEVSPAVLPTVANLIAEGADPKAVIEGRLGGSLDGIQHKLVKWLDERRAMSDVMIVRYSDLELVEAWSALDSAGQAVVIAEYRERVAQLDTAQLRLVRALVAAEGVDAGSWPLASPPTHYDPEEHAPGLPIPRVMLAQDDERVRDLYTQVRSDPDPDQLLAIYAYAWGEGRVRRTGDPADIETVFKNATNGFAPEVDLARAIALLLIDGGEQRKVSAALAHSYTDREGHVFPGVTMYQAWLSGIEMEMPDVDALGIIHDVLDDHDTWVSPIPGSQHDVLYGTIEEMFKEARRYRDFREILAGCLLIDRPVRPEGFESAHINLHALWRNVDEQPGALLARLPQEANWHPFFQKWVQRCRRDPRIWTDGWRRDIELRGDRRAVRDALIAVLEKAGVLHQPHVVEAGK